MNLIFSEIGKIQNHKTEFIDMAIRLENYINEMIHESHRLKNIYDTVIEDYDRYVEQKCKIIITYNDTTPIGLIVFWCDDNGTGYINVLFLEKLYRNTNIGTELFNKAKMWFEKVETNAISVGTPAKNTIARKFYERLGFIEESIGYMYSIK